MNNVRNGDFQLDPAYGPSPSSSGGGDIAGLVAGQNILIDVTDPAHPIVSMGGTAAPVIAVIPDGAGPGVDVLALVLDGGTAIQLVTGGGVNIASQSNAFVVNTAAQDIRFIGTKPMLLPWTEDGGDSLDAATYRGSIIYDRTSESLLYSNGTEWIHFIASVDAGTGIAVDVSQPAHPIVSVSP